MLEWLPMNTIKFKSTGWQAPIADGFTAVNLTRVIQAVVHHITDNPEYGFSSPDYKAVCKRKGITRKRPLVIIGYDNRFMSEHFARLVASIFSKNNIVVKISDKPVPSGVVSFSVKKHSAIGAVMITGGDTPYHISGFRWISFWAGAATPEITDDIEKRMSHSKMQPDNETFYETEPESSLIEKLDFKKDYLKHLTSLLNIQAIKKRKIKLGLDLLNGTTTEYLSELLNACGVKTINLRKERDVFFGKTDPITGPKSLSALSKSVVKNKLDLGIACDADGDGFGVIDSDGVWISPNEVIALILEHTITNRKAKTFKVCRNVVTSHLIDAVSKKYNVTVRETPIGFSNIGQLMSTGQYLLGAEESGGLSISDHIPDKDGILACMLVLELISHHKKPLKVIRKQFHKDYGDFTSTKISIPSKGLKISDVMRKLELKPPLYLAGYPVWRIDHTDGFKFILKDLSWIAIRPSAAEPIVRLYAEATGKAKLDKIVAEGKKILEGKL